MKRCAYQTDRGTLVYWVSDQRKPGPALVFLPGLTADHRLFDKQVAHFRDRFTCLVWDPPAHGESRPFTHEFILDDWAVWLKGILGQERIVNPVLVGQSMGGYLSQVFFQLFPGQAAGFVCIDSAPLQRCYYSGWELWALKHTRAMYLSIPWKLLVSWGAWGTAESEYGRNLMRTMMLDYRKTEYCSLASAGYAILAHAVESERPFEITCPIQLICGMNDKAGSTRRYNRTWTQQTGFPLAWIEGAGHNSNTDAPEQINVLIEEMMSVVCV